MTAQPIKHQKLAASAADELLALILRGDFTPGQRLPPERVLAEQMNISRTSLRDGIARLEVLGHLEARQGNGVFIREPSAAHLTQSFQGMLIRSPQKLAHVLEFRQMIEPEVAAQAAARATPTQIAQLQHCLDRQEAARARHIKLSDEDMIFHQLIAQIAGNEVVMLVLDTLRALLAQLRNQVVGDQPEVTIAEHRRVVNAIASASPQAAREAMLFHMQSVRRHAAPLIDQGADNA
ncbi:FadR/GntR family transcriptional regulator [Deinococcus aerophilus]|uniref:GntR family transcriptional regulator n=1 Tax=Deinococcus aerophilus TaxID=522488 RepID=A0ABQ2GJY1_9DEIO|nr:FadR/GntR family transcriptional regulator [Deinococcus aerophilus]GGL99211.1 GntR family transcriptional regulator [Deinococcus aerophilus]